MSLSRERTWLLFLFALAVVVRLGYALVLHPAEVLYSNDARDYQRIAVQLVQGQGFQSDRAPLTPFVLAGLYALAGADLLWARLLFALAGGLTAAGVYAVARRLEFAPVAAMLSALLAALYPMLVFVSAEPLTENLALPLLVYVVLVLLLIRDTGSVTWQVLAGLLLGLATLNRDANVGLAPFVGLWMLLALRVPFRRRLIASWIVLAVTLVTVSPWLARNYVVSGTITLTPGRGWNAIFVGNSPHFLESPLLQLEPGRPGDPLHPDDLKLMYSLSPGELRAFVIRYALENPGRIAWYSVYKFGLFWGWYPHPVDKYSWLLVLPFAVGGLVFSFRDYRRFTLLYLVIGVSLSVHVVSLALPRYRVSIMPFVLMFAALGVSTVSSNVATLWTRFTGHREVAGGAAGGVRPQALAASPEEGSEL